MATKHVSPTGSGSLYTEANPGLLTGALATAVAGDTILMHAGTYDNRNLTFANAGTGWGAGQFITVTSAGDGDVIISPSVRPTVAIFYILGSSKQYYSFSNIILDGRGFDRYGFHMDSGSSHYRYTNVEVRNLGNEAATVPDTAVAGWATGAIASTDITLTNCQGHHIGLAGVTGGAHGVYFAHANGVTIQGGSYYSNGGRGIQFWNGFTLPHTFNVVIDGVRMYDNGDGGTVQGASSNFVVKNCLIYNNNRTGQGSGGGWRTFAGSPGVKLYNNTIWGNTGHGSSPLPGLQNDQGNIETKNNIIQNNSVSAGNCGGTCSGTNFATNLIGGTAVEFEDAANGDFRLKATATTAIDRGTTLADVLTDFDGLSRPQGTAYDIGAHEFQSTPIIAVSPTSLVYTMAQGDAPESQTITVTNTGAPQPMPWSVVDNQTWLSSSPTSASDVGTFQVTVDVTGVALGLHGGVVTVTAPAASNSPALIPVTLTVEPAASIDTPLTSPGHRGVMAIKRRRGWAL